MMASPSNVPTGAGPTDLDTMREAVAHAIRLAETPTEAAVLVASLRDGAASAAATVTGLRAAWEAEHAETLALAATARQLLDQAEERLRALATVSGEKHPAPGVQVVTRTVLDYDRARAFAWATEHRLALALDVKAFEKLAKAGGVSGVVQVRTEHQVRIATDLAGALAEAGVWPPPAATEAGAEQEGPGEQQDPGADAPPVLESWKPDSDGNFPPF